MSELGANRPLRPFPEVNDRKDRGKHDEYARVAVGVTRPKPHLQQTATHNPEAFADGRNEPSIRIPTTESVS